MPSFFISKKKAKLHAPLFELIFLVNGEFPFVTTFFIVNCYTVYLTFLHISSSKYQFLLIDIFILIYLSSICLFIYHIYLAKLEKKQAASSHHQEQNHIDKVNSFKHDYKGLLLSLTTYIEQNKTKEALDLLASITDYSNERLKDESCKTIKNIQPIPVQSLLAEKIKRINALKIHYSLAINKDIYITAIATLDYIRCLDIILNNAIEAAQSARNPHIDISIIQTNEVITLTVKNNFEASNKVDLSEINKKNFSTKTDHQGIGLYNLAKITHKYEHVAYSISIQNNLFVLELTIALE